ncbi:MAG: hypothetical protein LBK43_00540 [Treponema sp.]|jgi:hypothetical protein|nr:hypothetical protein [Treponema sp.]
MKTTKRLILEIAALMVALAACTDLTEPGELSGEPIPQGMGQAHIRLGLLNARTALPSLDGLYFTLDFTADGKDTVSAELNNGLTLTVALESGDWELEVKGYRDSSSNMDSPMLKGESSITVTAGISSPVAVYLTPDFSSGGTGTLSYSVTFPNTVSRAFLVLYPLADPGTLHQIDMLGTDTETTAEVETDTVTTAEGTTATMTIKGLPVGSFQAFIDLYDRTNNQATVWTGVVHIYDGSTTPLAQTVTPANFAASNPLEDKLEAVLAYPSGSYIIFMDGTETVGPLPPLTITDGKDITLTLKGNGQTVSLGSNGSLLTLGADTDSSLTLILEDITLEGTGGNNVSLVQVNSGGNLDLKAGSVLTGNTSTGNGGGVSVAGGGTLTMSGGEISGNKASSTSSKGGGVYVANGGKFIMNDGAISGNSTPTSGSGSDKGGGGVYVAGGGEFTMNGGEVSGNTSGYDGGGVLVLGGGTFTMTGGEISGNTATYGGGVYNRGTFTMTGGIIYGSEAEASKRNTGSNAAVYPSSNSTIDKR